MRKLSILVLAFLLVGFANAGDDDKAKPFKIEEDLKLELYFMLTSSKNASITTQLQFLHEAEDKVVPKSKWFIPVAIISTKPYSNSSTIKITFIGNPLRDGKKLTEKELVDIAKKVIKKWSEGIQALATAENLAVEKELKLAQEYQKSQTKLKLKRKALEDNLKLLQERLAYQKLDLVEQQAALIAIAKKKSLIAQAIKKNKDLADRLKEESVEVIIQEIDIQVKIESRKAMKESIQAQVKEIENTLDGLSEPALLSEKYLTQLAERAQIKYINPVLIGGLGDALKLAK